MRCNPEELSRSSSPYGGVRPVRGPKDSRAFNIRKCSWEVVDGEYKHHNVCWVTIDIDGIESCRPELQSARVADLGLEFHSTSRVSRHRAGGRHNFQLL